MLQLNFILMHGEGFLVDLIYDYRFSIKTSSMHKLPNFTKYSVKMPIINLKLKDQKSEKNRKKKFQFKFFSKAINSLWILHLQQKNLANQYRSTSCITLFKIEVVYQSIDVAENI